MVSSTASLVGIGIYAPEEAAFYARLRTEMLKRWVFGDGKGVAVIDAQLKGRDDKLVTFLDFVQAMAVRSVRLCDHKFPLQKIRRARDIAKEKYGLEYPLAAKDHRIYLFGPKDKPSLCELLIEVGRDAEGLSEYVQLSGKSAGNRMITRIVEPFMHGLEFGDSEYAERFVAWGTKEHGIVMDPHLRLGEPYLPSCGYTARALWEAYIAEGGVEPAANAYGVPVSDIELACEYYDYLVPVADAA